MSEFLVNNFAIHEDSWILTLIIVIPLLGALMIMLPSRNSERAAGPTALWCSLMSFAITVVAIFAFYHHVPRTEHESLERKSPYVLRHHAPWITTGETVEIEGTTYPTIDISYRVGVPRRHPRLSSGPV